MDSSGPIFSEKQAGAILRRAAELSASSSAGGSAGSTSLADMERIAAEIGIAPEHVRAAAAELSRAPRAAASGVIDLERVVPGELSEEAWEAVLSDLRRTCGDPGTPSQVGQAREWVLKDELRNLHVSLSSRQGRTRIQLLENHSGALGLCWTMWAIFSFIVMLIATLVGGKAGGADQALINFLITGGVSGTAFLGIRTAAGHWYRTQRERMDGLLNRISGLAGSSPALSSVEEAQNLPSGIVRPTAETAVEQQIIGSSGGS